MSWASRQAWRCALGAVLRVAAAALADVGVGDGGGGRQVICFRRAESDKLGLVFPKRLPEKWRRLLG